MGDATQPPHEDVGLPASASRSGLSSSLGYKSGDTACPPGRPDLGSVTHPVRWSPRSLLPAVHAHLLFSLLALVWTHTQSAWDSPFRISCRDRAGGVGLVQVLLL